jgi:hypothetical protein
MGGGSALTGVLVGGTGPTPGAIAGVRWESGTLSGVTDAAGSFQYVTGGTVTFFVSDLTLATVPGAPQVSPWQLTAPTCTAGAALDKALVLLLSLDADGDPSTGTALTPFPAVTPRRDLSTLSMADIVTRIGQLIPGRAALTAAQANDAFIRQVDDEAWTQVGLNTFTGTTALQRGQGVANDGTFFYFSGTYSLDKTDLSYTSVKSNALAIPLQLSLAGSNHIGDIDVYNGKIYAPIEDGSAYQHPKVVLYDTSNLSSGTIYDIPQNLQTQGVPWIAIDAPRAFAYLAEWNPTTQLNRFTLSTMQYASSLPMTPPSGVTLGRIQGAEVFEGALYLCTDDSGKTVYKMNLDTGTVLKLFSIQTTGEVEGITFLARPDGSQMHTENVTPSSSGLELRHHQRTRLPLRRTLCP